MRLFTMTPDQFYHLYTAVSQNNPRHTMPIIYTREKDEAGEYIELSCSDTMFCYTTTIYTQNAAAWMRAFPNQEHIFFEAAGMYDYTDTDEENTNPGQTPTIQN